MGLRSIRLSLRHQQMFLIQLRAMLRASVEGEMKILFPMISCLEELQTAKALLEEAKEQLREKGQPFAEKIQVGMMVEVPSAAFLSDTFAREVDFFSVGTNDLIQYTLAVDRHNEQVAYLFNPLNPAVLRLLRQVIRDAHAARIPVSLCGEMAGDPMYLQILLGMGIDEVSMNPPALPYARHLIRCSSAREARALTRRVLAMDDPAAMRATVQTWMAGRFPEFFTSDGHADILGGL